MKTAPLSPSAGNRCGHDPKVPRLGPDQSSPEAGPGGLGLTHELAALWFHQPQNSPVFQGPGRQIRSERREACLAVLSVILRHLYGPSLRVGLPMAEGGLIGLDLKTIAKESGLGLRRSQRTVAWLAKAGLIALTESVNSFPGLKHGSYYVVRIANSGFLKNLMLERKGLAQNPPTAGPEGQP